MDLTTAQYWIKNILLFFTTIYSVHSFLYQKSPKYYFFLKRFVSRWKDTKWELTAIYKTSLNANSYYTQLARKLSKYATENEFKYQVIFRSENKQQFRIDDFVFTVQYNFDATDNRPIQIEYIFAPITATYNSALKKLTNVKFLLHSIETLMEKDEKNYSLSIFFTNVTNPFYGIMLSRIGVKKIKSFRCTVDLSDIINNEFNAKAYTSKVDISKNKVTINQSDFERLEYVAKKCLMIGE